MHSTDTTASMALNTIPILLPMRLVDLYNTNKKYVQQEIYTDTTDTKTQ